MQVEEYNLMDPTPCSRTHRSHLLLSALATIMQVPRTQRPIPHLLPPAAHSSLLSHSEEIGQHSEWPVLDGEQFSAVMESGFFDAEYLPEEVSDSKETAEIALDASETAVADSGKVLETISLFPTENETAGTSAVESDSIETAEIALDASEAVNIDGTKASDARSQQPAEAEAKLPSTSMGSGDLEDHCSPPMDISQLHSTSTVSSTGTQTEAEPCSSSESSTSEPKGLTSSDHGESHFIPDKNTSEVLGAAPFINRDLPVHQTDAIDLQTFCEWLSSHYEDMSHELYATKDLIANAENALVTLVFDSYGRNFNPSKFKESVARYLRTFQGLLAIGERRKTMKGLVSGGEAMLRRVMACEMQSRPYTTPARKAQREVVDLTGDDEEPIPKISSTKTMRAHDRSMTKPGCGKGNGDIDMASVETLDLTQDNGSPVQKQRSRSAGSTNASRRNALEAQTPGKRLRQEDEVTSIKRPRRMKDGILISGSYVEAHPMNTLVPP